MSNSPISTTFYVECAESESGAFPVHFPDASGETHGSTSHLRLGKLEDLLTSPTIYVEHQACPWPFDRWDCEEVIRERLFEDERPRKFTKAAMVFVPQMDLI